MKTLVVTQSLRDPAVERLGSLLEIFAGFPAPTVVSFEAIGNPMFEPAGELGVVFLSGNWAKGQAALCKMRKKFRGHIFAVGSISDPRAILETLKMGADQFIDEAEFEAELQAALSRLLSKPEGPAASRLLSVVSASGGCGVSTLAVNLAAAIAKDRERCLLVDLNAYKGDLASLLDLKPQFSLADVCANEARDEAMLKKAAVRHESGIHLLGSPPRISKSHMVSAQGLRHAISLFRASFADIVADLEDCYHPEQVELLKQANGVLVVLRLDYNSVRNTRHLLDHLSWIDIPMDRIKLVVNQQGLPNELIVEEVEEALQAKINCFIPHDPKAINASNNTGVPVVLKEPASKVSQSILGLLDRGQPKAARSSGLIPNLRQLFKGVFPGPRLAQ